MPDAKLLDAETAALVDRLVAAAGPGDDQAPAEAVPESIAAFVEAEKAALMTRAEERAADVAAIRHAAEAAPEDRALGVAAQMMARHSMRMLQSDALPILVVALIEAVQANDVAEVAHLYDLILHAAEWHAGGRVGG